MRPGPDFFLIGASRCGTTTMARWLAAHPDIFVAARKELFFFSHQRAYSLGVESYLESHFSGSEKFRVRGEATSEYCNVVRYPWTPERIAQHFPNAHILFIVRHPLRRIESHWLLACASHGYRGSLDRFIVEYPQAIEISRYWSTIQAYRRFFPAERIRVLAFERFVADAARLASEVYSFLGVQADRLERAPERSASRRDALSRRPDWMQRLKNSGLRRLYAAWVPAAYRERIHRRLAKPLVLEPTWTAASLDHVREALQDESCQTLRFLGLEASYWDWNERGLLDAP